jgi:hypothetical protein
VVSAIGMRGVAAMSNGWVYTWRLDKVRSGAGKITTY